MKYTKNFPLKLAALGFAFAYDNIGGEDDPELFYQVYRKGIVEVTVAHNEQKIIVGLNTDEDLDELDIKSLEDLDTLTKLLKPIKKATPQEIEFAQRHPDGTDDGAYADD
jgi:hypothetical protein